MRNDWKSYLIDAMALAGAALIVFGASKMYPPLGYVLAGSFLFGASLIFSRSL